MKIRVNKNYCIHTIPHVRSKSPFHTEYWFYDVNGEYVFGAIEHKSPMFLIYSTDIRICGIEENYAIHHSDGFMKLNEMRDAFYNALKDKDKKEFFLRQHEYSE